MMRPSSDSVHPIETDAVVVGAGPVGLFQVFQLGLHDIHCHVIDALPHAGGQPVELYPDKPIYDVPAIPVCSGQELVDALLKQIQPFNTPFHLAQEVTEVQPQADGRWRVGTSNGAQFLTRTVFVAAGVGAFQTRRLKLAGIETFEGQQVVYRQPGQAQVANQHVVVLGEDESALECAIAWAEQEADRAKSVCLLHRRDVFKAAPERVARMRALCEAGRLALVIGQPLGIESQGATLTGLLIQPPEGKTFILPADRVVALLGLSPRLGPLAQWGLAMERKQLVVNPETFATSEPGIFAVGDINTYPGKRKLLVSGFHECALAAFAAAPVVHPERPVLLQYTTTSTTLHQRLGVAPPATHPAALKSGPATEFS
jgi:thioredoxin reductase (NADPH)